jgi:hypothetical protein
MLGDALETLEQSESSGNGNRTEEHGITDNEERCVFSNVCINVCALLMLEAVLVELMVTLSAD